LVNYTDNYILYPLLKGDGAFGNGNPNNYVLRWKDIPATPFRFSVKIKGQTSAIGAYPNLINIKSKSGTAAVEGSLLGPVAIQGGSQSGIGSCFEVLVNHGSNAPGPDKISCCLIITLNPVDGSLVSAKLFPENVTCCPDWPSCDVPNEKRAICETADLNQANCGSSPGKGGLITSMSTDVMMQADFGSAPCNWCGFPSGGSTCPRYTTSPPCTR
jgi:hypothetical protein